MIVDFLAWPFRKVFKKKNSTPRLEEFNDLNRQLEAAHSLHAHFQDQICATNKQNSDLVESLGEERAFCEKIKNDVETLKKSLEAERFKFAEEISFLEQQVSLGQDMICALNDDAASSKELLKNADSQIAELTEQLSVVTGEKTDELTIREQVQKDLQAKTDEYERSLSEKVEKLQAVQTECDQSQRIVVQKDTELKKLQIAAAALKRQMDQDRDASAIQAGELQNCKNQLAVKDEQIERLQSENRTFGEQLAKLSAELGNQRTMREQLQEELMAGTQKYDEMVKNHTNIVAEKSVELQKLQKQVKDFRCQMKAANDAFDQQAEKIEQYISSNTEKEAELQSLKEELHKAEKLVIALKRESPKKSNEDGEKLGVLKKQLEDGEAQRLKLKEQLFKERELNYAYLVRQNAYHALTEGRFEDALKYFIKATEFVEVRKLDEKLLARLWNDLGRCYMQTNNNELSAECFEKAIELDPSNASFHGNLGWTNFHLGDKQKARECARKSLQLDPNDSRASELLDKTSNCGI